MPAIDHFIQTVSSEHARVRSTLVEKLSLEQRVLLDEYASGLNLIDAAQERYIAFVEPILAGFSGLADEVLIEKIKSNPGDAIEVILSARPGVSISSLLMDYPALPFALNANGDMVNPDVSREDQTVYSGIMVSSKNSAAHWQAMVGGQLVSIKLQTDSIAIEEWKNPGWPVATVTLGDVGGSPAWQAFAQIGAEYWIQPSNSPALTLLDGAKLWKQETVALQQAREEFNGHLANIPSLQSAQAKIVVNALFAWACSSGQELPSKEDFSVWTPPRGNVIAMHSAQDWSNLVADKPSAQGLANSAQEKIHTMSERLPNIWRFTDEASIAVLCNAMVQTRTRLQADQSLSI